MRESPAPGTRDRDGDATIVDVHMADPGRLKELLLPDRRVWIRWAASPTRKTDWSAVLVEAPDGRGLVSIDTTLPNRLIRRALESRALEELEGWELERAEFPLGRSRIDFLLARDGRRLALEVKSVTLVEDGVALFPDAVTARGARHVRELAEVAGSVDAEGRRWEAAILFVLQRPDARRIEAARSIDPDFADALAEAKAAGVRVLGRRCRVTPSRLELGGPVPAG
ncbi:MAG: DNA/RNA nuclease SfsA [Gemmatimonadetes bacterium]|nr:DNA/RNA nuclease SfsA [Gemmatimonadota bacterium]NIQ57825.1 DNA/RNA nuclease SfsA [Gemmatimonadota bacterium]NIU77978.1 DNA/RNA nuclease SfsA [Gammaproteobacteria bacterium]NIX47053.1 DNA/RNA nuclease SfsA [Gemmatimonadota bacterium]NIY11431.1 DNA/RNA nuclease SfsA [Gemmatimonadota bacterium]